MTNDDGRRFQGGRIDEDLYTRFAAVCKRLGIRKQDGHQEAISSFVNRMECQFGEEDAYEDSAKNYVQQKKGEEHDAEPTT